MIRNDRPVHLDSSEPIHYSGGCGSCRTIAVPTRQEPRPPVVLQAIDIWNRRLRSLLLCVFDLFKASFDNGFRGFFFVENATILDQDHRIVDDILFFLWS